jgi:preprotein translocase subunit SecG
VSTWYYFLLIAYSFFSVIMIMAILLRKGDGGGLSGAFGMGGDSAFGVKAAQGLDKIITILACIFLVLGLYLNTPKVRQGSDSTSGAKPPAESEESGDGS